MTEQTPEKPAWPKFADGTTDWETVFEAPDTGLIAMIGQAKTAAALRQCTVLVIQQLHTRKDDPQEVARFVAELDRLVPDHTPPEALPRVSQAIAAILRQIKEGRIERAARHAAKKSEEAREAALEAAAARMAEDRPADSANAADEDGGLADAHEDRRNADDDADTGIPEFRLDDDDGAEKRPPFGLIGAAAAALILVVGVGAYIWFSGSPADEIADAHKVFIEQMNRAASGNGPEEHVYGGGIQVGKMAGRTAVTAESVPAAACESVGWTLGTTGSVMIAGTMPRRVTPKALKELCGKDLFGTTIIWLPRKRP